MLTSTNFNPRTREGCDPVWHIALLPREAISIHAPVKGATQNPIPAGSKKYHFNPRTREGCDVHDIRIIRNGHSISIHAPVKGATFRGYLPSPGPAHFNPRTREGCDAKVSFRHMQYEKISIHAPVKGATVDPATLTASVFISIHAPVKGATPSLRRLVLDDGHFNPRTREGCDPLPIRVFCVSCPNFNPRTREGCDLRVLNACNDYKLFQSTHP